MAGLDQTISANGDKHATRLRIGVYVCHCGHNIAGTVDVADLAQYAATLPGVVVAKEYKYMCSEPGQELIINDIKQERLNRVVVAACSPTMHEPTFRAAVAQAGLNQFLFQMANIREHCSWVTEDKQKATEKAKSILGAAVRRVALHQPMEFRRVGVTDDALVIGGGIAGIEAALTMANAGRKVYLVEKDVTIGGHMAQFDKTFPTLDCSACILTPKMTEVSRHPNITLLTNSKVEEVSGFVGNFDVRVREKARYVDVTKCTACGDCLGVCPVQVPEEFDLGLSLRKAIYRPFAQSVPSAMAITKEVAPCKNACPVGTNAAGYIALINKKKYKEALDLIRQTNPLPAVCGRVCHRPCEKACNRAKMDEPVAICYLKRFVSDWVMSLGEDEEVPNIPVIHEQKVAVVGAGPAGLACARELRLQGFAVEIFERAPVAGGMLTLGIPSFRLPRNVMNADIDRIQKLGVVINCGKELGKDFTIEDLRKKGFAAIFLGIGAWVGTGVGVPGDDLEGVRPGIAFLRDVNLGYKVVRGDVTPGHHEVWLGNKVAVIGGGNAALDVVRTALRLGAKEANIYYRRTRAEMPAEPDSEITDTEEEGVKINYLVAPKRIIGRNGKVRALELQRMELGPPDESGRRRPVPIPGSEYTVEVDMVLPAIGQKVDSSFLPPELELTKWGTIKVDELTLQTSMPGVFAGGDSVLGPATVIEAEAAGKAAAESIMRFLKGLDLREGREKHFQELAEPVLEYVKRGRTHMKMREPETRRHTFEEVELGYTEEQALEEAQRCLMCGVCVECQQCVTACARGAILHEDVDKIHNFKVGAIVVATGFDQYDPTPLKQYGYGRLPNVLTGLEFERLANASGPTEGRLTLKNGKRPKSVAILHCIGSRDQNTNPYCSKICCMYSLKTAHLVREKTGAEVYEMYIDMRTGGKGYEEFYDRLLQEGVLFIRGKGAAVTDVPETDEERGRLVVKVEDTLLGVPRRIPVDMVVLSCAIVPRKDSLELARVLRLGCTGPGWFAERHPKLAPVSTPSDGIFIAGCCQGPKDIPDSVAQGAAAAAQAMSLLGLGHVNVEPVRAEVDEAVCSGCRICVDLCPYQAIEFNQEKLLAHVNDVLCKACGVCVAACPSGALNAKGFTDEQIFAEIEGALRILPTPALELAGR